MQYDETDTPIGKSPLTHGVSITYFETEYNTLMDLPYVLNISFPLLTSIPNILTEKDESLAWNSGWNFNAL